MYNDLYALITLVFLLIHSYIRNLVRNFFGQKTKSAFGKGKRCTEDSKDLMLVSGITNGSLISTKTNLK